MLKRLTVALGLLLAPVAALAQSSVLPYYYNSSGVKVPVGSGNPLPVNATANLSPFTPGTSGARGTPVTVTTSDTSGNLPTNAGSVIVSNVGSNPMYCNVNGIAATVADQYISSSGGWFNFGIPAAITTLRCIATGGSTTANMVGGAGLGAGTGGGAGGGGGGGAVTIADGADVTQGALADAAASAGGTGSLSAKLRLMTTQLGTINTTLGSPFQAGGSIGNTAFGATQSGTWTVQPGNTANTTPWLMSPSQGGNTAIVKAGNTFAGTEVALGVAVVNSNINGQATMANSSPVVIASNQSAIPVTMTSTTITGTIASNITQVLGSAISATNGLFSNILQGNAVLSATNGLFSNILQGNAVLSATNPIFARATDGTRAAVVHPCEAAIQTYAPISITTATTTRIVAPSASNKTYICSMLLTSAAADNVGIVEGTGGTCGSGTAGVIGGTTAANGPNFAANGGLFIQAGGKVSVAQTAGTNVDLCLITSASTPLAGGINYVQAP